MCNRIMCNQITRNRIIYYYQTFVGLKPILVENTPVTHIHLSAVHFGKNKDGTPYIHINDNSTLHIKYFKNDTKILKILSTSKFEDILN